MVPIFRSPLQARLLLHVLLSDEPATAAELARILKAPEPTVSREVRRLLDAGLLTGERVGRATVVRPAVDNPATAPLRQLLIVTYGPAYLIEQALADVDGIEHAYVHGSWAARYQGEPGPSPGDVDVLIIGTPSRAVVDDALDALENQLGREINVTYLSADRWRRADDPFIATVRHRPLVELHPHRNRKAAN